MTRAPYYVTAYALAVKHGFKGTEEEWLESLRGAGGAQGPQGPKGEQGEPGDPGTLIVESQGNEASVALNKVLEAVAQEQNVVLLYGAERLSLVSADETGAIFTAVVDGQMTAKVVMDEDGMLSPQTFQLALKDDVKVVKVNLTATEEEGVYTTDRSYEEVVAAIDAGRTVVAVLDGTRHNYLFEEGGELVFTANVADYMSAIFINSENGAVADSFLLASADQIPTKVSQLENDSGYLHQEIGGDSLVSVPATSTTQGKIAYNDKTTDGTDHAEGIYSIFDVSGAKTIFVTGYQWQSQYNVYSYVFYDADGSTISKHLATADDTGFTDLEVTVPENAATIRINGKTPAYVPAVKGYEKIDVAEAVKQLVLEDKVTSVNGKTGAVELTADDVGSVPKNLACREVLIEPSSTVTGKIAWNENVTGGGEHAEGIYSVFDISGHSTIFVTGYQWQAQYSYYSYVIYDADGIVLDKVLAAADDTGFVDLEVAVPENAKTIRINGKTPLYTPVVKYLESVDVAEVIKDVVNAQKAPKVIFMGDSITALGLQPQGWVKYFLEATGCELIANTAVVGATLKDKAGTVYDGNPVFNGEDANENNVLGNQVQKILDAGYEAPDLIMIAIGTNDGIVITADDIHGVYYTHTNELVDLATVDRTTAAGAYRYCLETLHKQYPDAVICWCTPIHAHQTLRTAKNVMAWANSLKIATEYTGQILIDTIRCGINGVNEANNANGEYLMDGLHPNMNGAKRIGYYNAGKVLPFIQGGLVKG